MSKARDLSNFISDATVDASEIADLAVTHAKLHTDMNLSSKTLTFAANQISGNSVDGGVISNFASTGIDDNASSTAVTILSDGKVGIGETNPAEKLEISGNIKLDTGATQYIDLKSGTSGAKNYRIYNGIGWNSDAMLIYNHTDDATILTIEPGKLGINRGASSLTQALEVNGGAWISGNVGIGETNPLGKLHVKTADSGATADVSADELVIEGSGNTGISILSGTSGVGSIYFGDSGTNWDGYIAYNQSSRSMTLGTAAGGGSVNIDSSGNVGIGTSNGDVTGDGNASRTYVSIIGSSNRGRLNLGSTAANGADSGAITFVNGANELGSIVMDTNSGVQNAGKMYISSSDDILVRSISDITYQTTYTNSTAGHHIFKSYNTEIMRIDGGTNTVGVGRTPVNGMQFTVAQQSSLGGVVIGQVVGSINNNSEALLLHRLDGNTVGFQFSGEIYCNSWTGQAHVNFNAVAKYTNDAISWFINGNGAGSTVSKVQLKLATISYASGTYLAVIKDGGGTGVFYINGFLGSNMESNGGVRAVASGQYTVTTTHVNLN